MLAALKLKHPQMPQDSSELNHGSLPPLPRTPLCMLCDSLAPPPRVTLHRRPTHPQTPRIAWFPRGSAQPHQMQTRTLAPGSPVSTRSSSQTEDPPHLKLNPSTLILKITHPPLNTLIKSITTSHSSHKSLLYTSGLINEALNVINQDMLLLLQLLTLLPNIIFPNFLMSKEM